MDGQTRTHTRTPLCLRLAVVCAVWGARAVQITLDYYREKKNLWLSTRLGDLTLFCEP